MINHCNAPRFKMQEIQEVQRNMCGMLMDMPKGCIVYQRIPTVQEVIHDLTAIAKRNRYNFNDSLYHIEEDTGKPKKGKGGNNSDGEES